MVEWSERAPQRVAHEVSVTDDPAVEGTPTGSLTATEAPRERRGSGWWEIVETLLVALLLFFGMRQVIPSVEVDGLSMTPSLTNHQRLLVNRLAYTWFDVGGQSHFLFSPPQRGDIVVINPPPRVIESFWDSFRNQFTPRGPRDEPYIKRIIGLPGDRIRIGEGRVYVNGTPINEDYIKDPPDYVFPLPTTAMLPRDLPVDGPITIGSDGSLILGPDQYFMLGDNRRASSDSHYFGPISSRRIIGKAWVSIWPWDQGGFLPHKTYPNIPANG